MAKPLVCPQRTPVLLMAAAWLACMPLQAASQALMDPTRPAGDMTSSVEATTQREKEPVLQSVLIAPGRTFATIDGKVVRVGDKVGGGRVIRIAENEVALQVGNHIRTLKLFPELAKRRGTVAAGDRSDRAN